MNERIWIIMVMRKDFMYGGRPSRPIPFGPYTYEEMHAVEEAGVIDLLDDEYIVHARLRTLGV